MRLFNLTHSCYAPLLLLSASKPNSQREKSSPQRNRLKWWTRVCLFFFFFLRSFPCSSRALTKLYVHVMYVQHINDHICLLTPESWGGKPALPLLVLRHILPNWFSSGGAGLRIDNSAWVWQLRVTHTHTHTDTPHVYIASFFSPCSPTAVSLPPELSINSLLIKNLFCYLRWAFIFSSTSSTSSFSLVVKAACKSWRERGEEKGWGKSDRRKEKKRVADIHKWERDKKN